MKIFSKKKPPYVKPKAMLVVGGAGFIGSHFVEAVVNNTSDVDTSGVEVAVVDALTYAGNKDYLSSVEDKIKLWVENISNDDFFNSMRTIFPMYDTIVNFAAESHVDRSFENYRTFIDTNIKGEAAILKAIYKAKNLRHLYVSCYDTATRALTKDGLKYYDELKIGDVVFTLNASDNLEEQPIENIIIQDYSGDMISLSNRRVDILVTPNHRMYDRNLNVFEACDLLRGSKYKSYELPYPVVGIGCKDSIIIDGKEVDLCDLFYLSGIFIGDGFLAYQEKELVNKSGLSRQGFLSRRNSKGQFVSGRTGDVSTTTSKGWRIFIDVPENDKCRKRLEDTLSRLDINYSIQKGKSGEHIYFTSEVWSDYFKQFGEYAQNKTIPEWMLQYDPQYLMCLFKGLMDSDGHVIDHSCFMYSTVSIKLTEKICELGLKVGYYPKVYDRYCESYIDGRKISGSSKQILFGMRPRTIRYDKICTKEYNGKVWCIKVKNKNFLTERNGCFSFSGNTDEIYGTQSYVPSVETTPADPTNIYSITKVAAEQLVAYYHKNYGVNTIVTRGSNTYGTRQYPEKVIPWFINNLLKGIKCPVYGKGEARRYYMHVDDHVNGILHALYYGEAGEAYNVGATNSEYSTVELATILISVIKKISIEEAKDSLSNYIEFIEDRVANDRRYMMNSQKLTELSGWYPKRTLVDGIEEVIDYYRERII
jgi:dTDP-D-glucose 4,6-dehydratase